MGRTFAILGTLHVERDGTPVSITPPRQRALLSLLLLHANQAVPQDELIEELWDGQAPATARASLQNHVHALRKALGADVLERHPAGYVLHVEPGRLDLERFRRLATGARGLPARERAVQLREALACWRGPALVDARAEAFAQTEIARLEEERLTALEERVDADLELGRHVELVAELEELVSTHPLRERFWAQLMLALYRAGRQADALATYRRAHQEFTGGLGLEPGVVLRELQRRILVQDPLLEDPERLLGSTLERAAALLPRDAREQAESLYDYGRALFEIEEREQAMAALRGAERMAAAAGERALQERVRLTLSFFSIFVEGGDPGDHLARAEEAAAVFEELRDDAGVAFALWHQAHIVLASGKSEQALALAQRGAEAAARAGDGRQQAACRGTARFCLVWGRRPLEEAFAACEEALATAPPHEPPFLVLRELAALNAQAGRAAEARALAEQALAAARDAGALLHVTTATAAAALIERILGDTAEAVRRFRTAYAMLEAQQDRGALADVAGELACTLARSGEIDEARQVANTARRAALAGDLVPNALWRRALALVGASEGKSAEAVQLAEEAASMTRASDHLALHGETLEDVSAVHDALGDADRAQVALEEALRAYDGKGHVAGATRVRAQLASR